MTKSHVDDLIKQHSKEMDQINRQRRLWLYASLYVFTGIAMLMIGWEWLTNLHSDYVWTGIVMLMLVISINWWYWTMGMVRKLLNHQRLELELISELTHDIRSIKIDVQDLMHRKIDL